MQKQIVLACLFFGIFPSISLANVRPVASVALGWSQTNVGNTTQYVTFISPYQNAYVSTHQQDDQFATGLFLGFEKPLYQNFSWQLGLRYYQNSVMTSHGDVYQFADPTFNNLSYDYQIQSRRYLIETKLLSSLMKHQDIHPYVTIGAGVANNKAFGYAEFPHTTDAVPTPDTFSGNSTNAFTYLIGLGVDVDVSDHVRLGASYQFANLGKVSLGTSASQISSNTLNYDHLNSNEFLLNMSYIG